LQRALDLLRGLTAAAVVLEWTVGEWLRRRAALNRFQPRWADVRIESYIL
jgi:hypothetical protein